MAPRCAVVCDAFPRNEVEVVVNHADVRAKMADYLEGHLPLADRALFDAHLDGCHDCANEISEIRATIAAMRSLPEPQVPGDFTTNVMRRIRAGDADPGWLGRLAMFLDEVGSPRVLVPVSAAVLSVGMVLWGQQVGLLSTTVPSRSAERTPSEPVAEQSLQAMASGRMRSPAISSDDARFPNPTQVAVDSASRSSRGLRVGDSDSRNEAPPSFSVQIVMGDGYRPPYVFEESGGPELAPIPWRSDPSTSGGSFGRGSTDGRDHGSVAVSSGASDSSIFDGAIQPSASMLSPEFGSRLAPPGRDPRSRDDWLAVLETNPADFAWRLSRLTLAERELWVDRLARHAQQNGALDRVISRLHSAGGADCEELAEEFASAGSEVPLSSPPNPDAR